MPKRVEKPGPEGLLVSRNEVRAPRQSRSRARVDAILQACKELIVERGSAGLKVQDIAARAGVTAGSMYQYFPNKTAIIEALTRQYMEEFRGTLGSTVAEPVRDLDDCVSRLHQLLDQFFTFYECEPVFRDLLVSAAADKSLQDLDIEDSRFNAEQVFTFCRDLFPEKNWPALHEFLFVCMHLASSAVQLALSLPAERVSIIDNVKLLISRGALERFMSS